MKAGWEIKPLGEVCEFQRGLTYAKSDEVDVSNNIVLRATNIDLATNLLDLATYLVKQHVYQAVVPLLGAK